MIPIQSTIIGYTGKPRTVFSAYNKDTRVLVVSKEVEFRAARREGCIVITNDLNLEQRDMLFGEEHLQAAITAFYTALGGVAIDGRSHRLVFSDSAARANPAQSIDKEGIDTHGQKYRISENITSAQMGALAACWYVETRVKVIDNMLGMADRLYGLEPRSDRQTLEEIEEEERAFFQTVLNAQVVTI